MRLKIIHTVCGFQLAQMAPTQTDKTGGSRPTTFQKGKPIARWSAAPFAGLHIECKLVEWWETSKCGPKTKETSFLSRKSADEEKGGLLGEKVVSHPCTTYQTMKIGSMPKMNQDGCKTRVRGPKCAAGCPENLLLSIESGVRPRRWSLGPQCPSR